VPDGLEEGAPLVDGCVEVVAVGDAPGTVLIVTEFM
jgi:hypothetical protein